MNHKYFLPPNGYLNGKRLQYETFFGRMLSVTVWPGESTKNHFVYNRFTSDTMLKNQVEDMSRRFYYFFDAFVGLMKKLLRNKETKEKALQWFRLLVNKNTGYLRMMPQIGNLTGKSVFLNSIAVFLELCAPFLAKPEEYRTGFGKIDPFYLLNKKYLDFGDYEKINSEQIEETKVDYDHEFNFVTECFFITHALIKIGYKKMMAVYTEGQHILKLLFRDPHPRIREVGLNIVLSMDAHLFAKRYTNSLFKFLNFSSFYFCYSSNQLSQEEEKVDFMRYADKV